MKSKLVTSKTGSIYYNRYVRADGKISGINIPPKPRHSRIVISKSGQERYNYYERQYPHGNTQPNAPFSDYNRKLCLERDDHTCQLCGSKRNVGVHHKDNLGPHLTSTPNNDLDNLITLCCRCHIKLHFGVIDKHKDIIKLHEVGMRLRVIGEKFNVSRQRIFQILQQEGVI